MITLLFGLGVLLLNRIGEWIIDESKRGLLTAFGPPYDRSFALLILGILLVVGSFGLLAFLVRQELRARPNSSSSSLPSPQNGPGAPKITEELVGRTFAGDRVDLDGKRFLNCIFRASVLRFAASAPVQFEGCRFENVQWAFDGSAARTFAFFEALHQAAPELVEAWFRQIRNEKPERRDPDATLTAAPSDPKWSNLSKKIVSGFFLPANRRVNARVGRTPQNAFSEAVDAIHANGHPDAGNAWRFWIQGWEATWGSHYQDFERRSEAVSDHMSKDDFAGLFRAYQGVVRHLKELNDAWQTFASPFGKHSAVPAYFPEKGVDLHGLLAMAQKLDDELQPDVRHL